MAQNPKEQLDYLSHIKKAKGILFGKDRPAIFTTIVFFIGIFVSVINLVWQLITWGILQFPNYLKQNKGVDVVEIVQNRGEELGVATNLFYDHLQLVQLIGAGLWLVVFISLFFLWRKKKWASSICIVAICLFIILPIIYLGWSYLREDITLFDKISVSTFLAMLVLHKIIIERNIRLDEDVNPPESNQKIQGDF